MCKAQLMYCGLQKWVLYYNQAPLQVRYLIFCFCLFCGVDYSLNQIKAKFIDWRISRNVHNEVTYNSHYSSCNKFGKWCCCGIGILSKDENWISKISFQCRRQVRSFECYNTWMQHSCPNRAQIHEPNWYFLLGIYSVS